MNSKQSKANAIYRFGFYLFVGSFICILLVLGAFARLGATLVDNSPPDIYVTKEVASPDGKNVASFYTISGGGAAGYVVNRLKIRPANQAFKADENYVFDMRHGDDIHLEWRDDDYLILTYPAQADIYRTQNKWGNIQIVYEKSVSKP